MRAALSGALTLLAPTRLALTLLALAACTSQDAWPPRQYACGDGSTFIAQYDAKDDRVVLHRPDGTLESLDRQFSHFGGARYSDSKVEFFEKRSGAVRMLDAKTHTAQFCTAVTY